MNQDYLDFVREMLSSKKAEALSWLRASGPTSVRNLGELDTTDASIAFVETIYNLGAVEVLAVQIEEYPEGQSTSYLMARLPSDQRDRLFAFEREHAESHGFDGTEDDGQEWLFIDVKG